jgi:transposase
MGKTYRAYLPEQDLLLPPSLRDWLAEDHLAYFVSDVVEQLDLSAIESVYEAEERGQPPYHPGMMTKILIYGYCVGVFSSRRMQKKLSEDVGFRVEKRNNGLHTNNLFRWRPRVGDPRQRVAVALQR